MVKENYRRSLGMAAEDAAAEYVQSKLEYVILARGFKWKRGEADLICLSKQGAVVLVEVRASAKISPWLRQSIGPHKLRALKNTLAMYRARNSWLLHREQRLEVIWIEAGKIEHWPLPLV